MTDFKNITLITVLVIALVSCSSSKRAKYSQAEIDKLHVRMEHDSLHFTARWALPMGTQSMNSIGASGLLPPGSSVNRIDLIGSNSYLIVKGDSVEAHLPYYGERQIAGIYNANDAGIRFKGVPRDFEMEFNEKRKAYEMAFSINDDDEAFDVNAVFFPNNKVSLYINSSQRLTIQYQGSLNMP